MIGSPQLILNLAHQFIIKFGKMVNQKSFEEEGSQLYLRMLDQLSMEIFKTSLPEFIINFLRFQKGPKLLLRQCVSHEKQGSKLGYTLSPSIGKRMQHVLTSIYERLSQLGDFGNLLKKNLSAEVDYFCPSLKKSNFIMDYSPSPLDKELIRIVDFHQKQSGQSANRCKLASQFQNNAYLAELEEKIRVFYELRRKREKSLEEVQRMDKLTNYLLSPHFREQYVDRRCLRCTSHFIQGSTTNACHPAISFYPIDSYDLTSYENFSAIENNVKASMCSMLNEPSGGVILVGCEREATTFLPRGLVITEKEKDSLQQKLEGYLAKISPKVKRNEEIFIDFVPVIQMLENPNRASRELVIMEPVYGTYVCRIFMQPKQNYKVYLLKASNEHSTLEARKDKESVTVPDAEHYNFIIQKFDRFYDCGDRLDRGGITGCHYSIKCAHPQMGRMAYEKKKVEEGDSKPKQEEAYEKEEESQGPKKTEQKVSKPVDIANKKLEEYKLWTLVVGDKAAIQKLLECANSEKENKGIKIEQLFADCKFKLTKTTWVMFHEEKFESMKKLAEKYNVTYKSKEIKMIASNVYLEIENEIYEQHYYALYNILATEYGCTIKDAVAKEVEGKKVWILWFENLKGSVYAYFYLSEHNYKVRFIRGASHFKNSLANSQNLTASGMAGQPNYGYGYYNQPGYQQGALQGSLYQPPYQQGYPQNYQAGYYPYG